MLTGLGAALHGFGLLSLAGAGLAALGRAHFRYGLPPEPRCSALLRLVAWGTAAYIGWIAVYIVVLGPAGDAGAR